MKHQYFGDINDYRKYGLLRALAEATGLPIGVCWMLTADDTRADGEFRRYLTDSPRWRHYDPGLYDSLRRLLEPDVQRSVQAAQTWHLVPAATYYAALLEDPKPQRDAYFRTLWGELENSPLLFFDPDNGLEVQSVKRGAKGSAKYLFWLELAEAYRRGHSVVVYQHFPRLERSSYTRLLADELVVRLRAPLVDTFATPHVLFLLAAQPDHVSGFRQAHELILQRWGGQIAPRAHVVG